MVRVYHPVKSHLYDEKGPSLVSFYHDVSSQIAVAIRSAAGTGFSPFSATASTQLARGVTFRWTKPRVVQPSLRGIQLDIAAET